jgi:H+/Cl- antiporter ClcA
MSNKQRRRWGIIGASLMSFMLAGILILSIDWPPAPLYRLAMLLGIGAGAIGSILLRWVYDFTHMRLRYRLPDWLEQGRLLILFALLAAASLLRIMLDDSQAVAIGSLLVTALIVFFLYLAAQAWLSRPQK